MNVYIKLQNQSLNRQKASEGKLRQQVTGRVLCCMCHITISTATLPKRGSQSAVYVLSAAGYLCAVLTFNGKYLSKIIGFLKFTAFLKLQNEVVEIKTNYKVSHTNTFFEGSIESKSTLHSFSITVMQFHLIHVFSLVKKHFHFS